MLEEYIGKDKFGLLVHIFLKELMIYDKRKVRANRNQKTIYTFGAGGYSMSVELVYK
jgi:hypothetical protein